MNLFEKTVGRSDEPLLDAILRVHDDAPNAEKRAWGLLAKAAEEVATDQADGGEVDLQPLAGALADAARRRRETIVSRVMDADSAMTRTAAEGAVEATAVGSTLADILDMAERIETAAPSLGKALDESLARQASERAVIERAKQLQVEKAKAGTPVSLVQAIELAKASSG
ncbi:hypothetical protein NAP1_13593 [Erythrobacter sp. NAP1]|uniref:hypothetical protein n=1 Tax=Erythrobacter sp. NAP1 TaxID=237727 RepID=UPI000068762B|nr:hypothetical protein [Erythrobacter sp. NAP1]EAQ28636.1 hypothetical protein NAP1_13593 [Erythrobacter sp. NAP1]